MARTCICVCAHVIMSSSLRTFNYIFCVSFDLVFGRECFRAMSRKPGGRVLCTTIAENAPMMKDLLDVHPVQFRPSIPNLVDCRALLK